MIYHAAQLAMDNIDGDVSLKTCRACFKAKPFTEFHINQANQDGRSYRCRECQKLYAAEYTRQRKNSVPSNVSDVPRRCSDCSAHKPLKEFSIHPLGKLGRSATCKLCVSARARAWKEANPGKSAATRRLKPYNLSPERFSEMVAAQNGRCAIGGVIPGNKPKSGGLHVDHCHNTGAVRGLLCYHCNNGLGKFKDDVERLQKAISYLTGGET